MNRILKITVSSGISETMPLGTAPLNASAPDKLPCQENFFRPEELGICVANCHTWSEFSQSVRVGTDMVILLTAIIGFITGLAVITISLLRFKKM